MSTRRVGVKRPNRVVLRAEAAAGGMRALARLLGVSPSTVHRWRTKGPTPRARELIREVKAAHIIGPTRKPRGVVGVRDRAQELLDFAKKREKQSTASRKGWRKRKLHKARERALGVLKTGHAPHGGNKEDWYVLRNMVKESDDRWEQFLEDCEDLGFTDSELKDEWFSPEV